MKSIVVISNTTKFYFHNNTYTSCVQFPPYRTKQWTIILASILVLSFKKSYQFLNGVMTAVLWSPFPVFPDGLGFNPPMQYSAIKQRKDITNPKRSMNIEIAF